MRRKIALLILVFVITAFPTFLFLAGVGFMLGAILRCGGNLKMGKGYWNEYYYFGCEDHSLLIDCRLLIIYGLSCVFFFPSLFMLIKEWRIYRRKNREAHLEKAKT